MLLLRVAKNRDRRRAAFTELEDIGIEKSGSLYETNHFVVRSSRKNRNIAID